MSSKWRLGIPIVAVLLLVLLAAGLSHVSFVGTRYGPPSDSPSPPSSAPPPPSPSVENGLSPLWTQVLAFSIGVLVIVSIVSVIFRPRNLWEAFKRALPAALWFSAIFLMLLRWRNRASFEREGASPGLGGLPDDPEQLFPSIEQVHIPSWVTFFFIFLVLVLLAAALLAAWRFWRARPRPIAAEELANITKRYAQELRTGSAVQETILRCYREMCQLLSERFHIEISRAMTAREFEKRLAQMSIHEDHINRLSRLFEWARYSAGRPTVEQEREALALLDDITRIYGVMRSSARVLHPV